MYHTDEQYNETNLFKNRKLKIASEVHAFTHLIKLCESSCLPIQTGTNTQHSSVYEHEPRISPDFLVWFNLAHRLPTIG